MINFFLLCIFNFLQGLAAANPICPQTLAEVEIAEIETFEIAEIIAEAAELSLAAPVKDVSHILSQTVATANSLVAAPLIEALAAFQKDQASASKILERVERLKLVTGGNNPGVFSNSMEHRTALFNLAKAYDKVPHEDQYRNKPKEILAEKTAILRLMLRIFKIIYEHSYMEVLANNNYSRELRVALTKSLRKMFKNDPSWIKALKETTREAGIPYSFLDGGRSDGQ